MKYWVYLWVWIAGLITPVASGADSDPADLIQRMQAGGHILMIRHALAPGFGDPPDFQIEDCSTQRNLDDRGRKQARAIGNRLRSNGISAARIYSSQWCRCLETAELLEMGPVKELPALNSFFELTQNREPHLKALRKFIAEQPSDGVLVILVTHQVTISAIADEFVSSGEAVLLKPNKDAPYEMVGRLNFDSPTF